MLLGKLLRVNRLNAWVSGPPNGSKTSKLVRSRRCKAPKEPPWTSPASRRRSQHGQQHFVQALPCPGFAADPADRGRFGGPGHRRSTRRHPAIARRVGARPAGRCADGCSLTGPTAKTGQTSAAVTRRSCLPGYPTTGISQSLGCSIPGDGSRRKRLGFGCFVPGLALLSTGLG